MQSDGRHAFFELVLTVFGRFLQENLKKTTDSILGIELSSIVCFLGRPFKDQFNRESPYVTAHPDRTGLLFVSLFVCRRYR